MYWHEPTDNTPDGEGFWSVATHAETLAVLRDPETYSSVTGGSRPYGGTLLQDLAIAGQVLNMMDDPRHSQIRRLVSSGLTPRMIRRVEDDLRARARRLLDAVEPGEPFDFLVDVAAELPMQMICILLGVPESERHWLFEAIEPQFDFGGSRKASRRADVGRGGRDADVHLRPGAYRGEAGASRPTTCCRSSRTRRWTTDCGRPFGSRAVPVLQPAVQRGRGDHAQRGRGRAACACRASRPARRCCAPTCRCCRPPSRRWCAGRRRRRRSGAPRPATSSWADAPSRPGRRCRSGRARPTATPLAFDNPDVFDIARKPNPHLGFGQGIHYCLGANLARLELRVLFEELLGRFSSVRVVKPVEWTRSNRHTGIRHLIVELEA